MTAHRDVDSPRHPTASEQNTESDERGWYLYGITRDGALPIDRAGGEAGGVPEGLWDESEPLQMVQRAGLAGVVRRVDLGRFEEESIRAHADDQAWLESIVQGHNRVVEEVHRQRGILPAKFGSVYARQEDISRALDDAREELLERLASVEDSDEWAVHLYVDVAELEHRAAARGSVQELQREIAGARPGRAYFLQRKMADEMAAAMDVVGDELAQAVHDRLAAHALDSRLSPPGRSPAEGDREVLRAAYLVSRAASAPFLAHLEEIEGTDESVRIDATGPWPPYSFATVTEELR